MLFGADCKDQIYCSYEMCFLFCLKTFCTSNSKSQFLKLNISPVFLLSLTIKNISGQKVGWRGGQAPLPPPSPPGSYRPESAVYLQNTFFEEHLSSGWLLVRTPIAQVTQYLLCENPAQDDVTFIKQRTKNSVVPEQQFSISGFQQ